MSKFYTIIDSIKYATDARQMAAEHLSPGTTENLDEYITVQQVINIIEENAYDTDSAHNDGYIINEEINAKIFATILVWIQNAGLSKLAAQNLLECAWDDKENNFIFWSTNSSTLTE